MWPVCYRLRVAGDLRATAGRRPTGAGCRQLPGTRFGCLPPSSVPHSIPHPAIVLAVGQRRMPLLQCAAHPQRPGSAKRYRSSHAAASSCAAVAASGRVLKQSPASTRYRNFGHGATPLAGAYVAVLRPVAQGTRRIPSDWFATCLSIGTNFGILANAACSLTAAHC